MKKLISVAVLLGMLLAMMVGCTPSGGDDTQGSGGGTPATGFRVGFARLDIHPKDSVPLRGYGNTAKRMSTGFLDILYATCIAITDESDNTVLLYATDLIFGNAELTEQVRSALYEQTGVPKNNIMITGSHTHSAPDVEVTSIPSIGPYREKYVRQLVQAGLDALDDRKPAQMSVGNVEVEGLNFVRHYLMSDGSYAGDNFGTFDNLEIVGHATEADTTMHLIRFTREGGEDVVMSNWRAHPTITGGATKYDVSADYVAPLRDTVEAELGCLFAFFQGDAGNMNPKSRITSETPTTDYRAYGRQLASFAIQGLNENMTPVESGEIKTKQIIFDGKINHTTDALLVHAQEVAAYWSKTNDKEGATAMGMEWGIRSPYHANAIVTRASMGLTASLELNAITVGDHVGFVTAPNELFDTYCVALKEASPYEMTMILGYANASMGYIPSKFGYEYTCYESDTTRFAEGTGEEVADTFLTMLNELHG